MENSPEFWKFVQECREKNFQISFPTIEIYWIQKQNEPIEETNEDEKTTLKKSKK
jgi:hypothetical protein